jgi:hypothetical protein
MRYLIVLALALPSLGCGLSLAAAAAGAADGLRGVSIGSGGDTCVSKFEDSTDLLNTICLYTCASGDAAITVHAYERCPLTITR